MKKRALSRVWEIRECIISSLFDVLVAIAIAVVVAKVSWCLGSSSLPPFPPPPHLPEDPDPVVTYISQSILNCLT